MSKPIPANMIEFDESQIIVLILPGQEAIEAKRWVSCQNHF